MEFLGRRSKGKAGKNAKQVHLKLVCRNARKIKVKSLFSSVFGEMQQINKKNCFDSFDSILVVICRYEVIWTEKKMLIVCNKANFTCKCKEDDQTITTRDKILGHHLL